MDILERKDRILQIIAEIKQAEAEAKQEAAEYLEALKVVFNE